MTSGDLLTVAGPWPLTDALRAARHRGVAVSVVIETLQGAGSALSGDEPYHAFTAVEGIELGTGPQPAGSSQGRRCMPSLLSPTGTLS
jgi:hypothetical protein